MTRVLIALILALAVLRPAMAVDDHLPADRHKDKSPKCLNDCGLGGTVVTVGCAAATFFTLGAASPLCTLGVGAMAACMDNCPPRDSSELAYTGPSYGHGFLGQYGTPLHETDATFSFAVADNGDLFAIKKSSTGSHSTEINVLSAASNYQKYILQTGTALHETDQTFEFALAPNRDLFAIKKSSTGSHSTEINVLSAASNYQKYILQTGTALHETDQTFEFALAPNRDLFAIKKSNTGLHSTEIHVLSAESNYQKFILQTGTALHETDQTFEFALAPNRDLFAIKKSSAGSHSTEIHVLSAESNYQKFITQKGTALHETGKTFAFAVTPGSKLMAIKESGTGSKSIEVHILDAP